MISLTIVVMVPMTNAGCGGGSGDDVDVCHLHNGAHNDDIDGDDDCDHGALAVVESNGNDVTCILMMKMMWPDATTEM